MGRFAPDRSPKLPRSPVASRGVAAQDPGDPGGGRDERERMSGRSLRNGGALLEAFKFAVYLAVPISMTVFVAYNRSTLEKVIKNRMYVVYPPEGPRPPSNEELWDKINKEKTKKYGK